MQMLDDAGASKQAADLFSEFIDQIPSPKLLEEALRIGQQLGVSELETRVSNRLESLASDSTVLAEYQIKMAVARHEYDSAARISALNAELSSQADFFRILHDSFQKDDVDYESVIDLVATCNSSWTNWGKRACLKHALSKRKSKWVLEYCLRLASFNTSFYFYSLEALEQLLQDRYTDGALSEDLWLAQKTLLSISKFLSFHPRQVSLRIRLFRVLSPETSGYLGLALLKTALMEAATWNVSVTKKEQVKPYPLDELLARKSELNKAFDWLDEQSPCMLGRISLPDTLVIEPCAEIVAAIAEFISNPINTLETELDVKSLENWMLLGCALAPHSSDPDADILLLRLTAGRLNLLGQCQQARNLAEQALIVSQTSGARMRKAWATVADIYQSQGNDLDTMIALLCTFTAEGAVHDDELAFELYVYMRLLRDMCEFDSASIILQHLKTIGGNSLIDSQRYRVSQLQLDFINCLSNIAEEPEKLEQLLSRAVQLAETVLDENDHTGPIASILGQLIKHSMNYGLNVPDDTHRTFEKLLSNMSTAEQTRLRVICAFDPNINDLVDIISQSDKPMYADDAAYDNASPGIAARQLLTLDQTFQDPPTVALAMELLCERSISDPDSDMNKPLDSSTATSALSIAESLARNGINVLFAAVDAVDRVTTLMVTDDGVKAERHSSETFSMPGLRQWSKSFPYAYAQESGDNNVFFNSTDKLKLSKIPDGPTVMFLDARIQCVPPNIFRVEDDFVGQEIPVASAPSVSWLVATEGSKQYRSLLRVVWIPTDLTSFAPLSALANSVKGRLDSYGINLITDRRIPDSLANAELVIVGAHGGISPDRQFFQTVADDDSNSVPFRIIHNSLTNVGTVILFVCSAGRVDRHPSANSTVGLVKQLLNSGCRSVLASPWPLEIAVAKHWLDKFLDEWDSGATIVQANFLANAHVKATFSADLRHCLAMNLYGSPFTKALPRPDRATESIGT